MFNNMKQNDEDGVADVDLHPWLTPVRKAETADRQLYGMLRGLLGQAPPAKAQAEGYHGELP